MGLKGLGFREDFWWFGDVRDFRGFKRESKVSGSMHLKGSLGIQVYK